MGRLFSTACRRSVSHQDKTGHVAQTVRARADTSGSSESNSDTIPRHAGVPGHGEIVGRTGMRGPIRVGLDRNHPSIIVRPSGRAERRQWSVGVTMARDATAPVADCSRTELGYDQVSTRKTLEAQ